MSDLPEIYLDILGPVLILIACGVGAGRWLDVSPEPLATLSFWVIGPAFMYNALATAGLPTGELVRLGAASALALAGAAAVALVATLGRRRARRATIVTASVYGNTGNFGLAIVIFTFDERAQAYAAVSLVVVNTIGLVVGIASSAGGLAGLRRALLAPMTLVVAPALVMNQTGATLPTSLDRAVELLAGAIIPVMLMMLGIQLVRMGVPRIDGDVVLALAVKLIVQPLVALGAVAALGLTGPAAGSVVLQAATPAAVFTSVLALELRTRPEQAATIVVAGTLASVVTLPWFILIVR
jgi:predicted permease